MNNQASLRAVTRRKFGIRYRSPGICQRASDNSSGSGSSAAAVIDISPVLRKNGTVVDLVVGVSELTLSWAPLSYAYGYLVYRSTSELGLYELVTSLISTTSYIDAPGAGTFYYKVTALEPSFGETAASNIVSGTL